MFFVQVGAQDTVQDDIIFSEGVSIITFTFTAKRPSTTL